MYPRRYCLGLIEAWACLTGDFRAMSYPRRYCLGLIEAAVECTALLVRLCRIRGVIASASLKRSQHIPIDRVDAEVSEALSPRPH